MKAGIGLAWRAADAPACSPEGVGYVTSATASWMSFRPGIGAGFDRKC
jgi:hypothetical protein